MIGRILFMLVCVFATAAGAQTTQSVAPAEQAYAGLRLRDHSDSGMLIVAWILPGPLEGTGFRSPNLHRGDLVLSVNDQKLSADQWRDLISRSKPGDRVAMKIRRTFNEEMTGVAAPGTQAVETDLAFTLARRGDWCGPVELGVAAPVPNPLPEPAAGSILPRIDSAVKAQNIVEPVAKITKHLADLDEDGNGLNQLSLVILGFKQPMRLHDVEKIITTPVAAALNDPRQIFVAATLALDVPPPTEFNLGTLDAKAISNATAQLESAVPAFDAEALISVLDSVWRDRSILDTPDARRGITAMHASLKIDYPALLAAAATLSSAMLAAPESPQAVVGTPGDDIHDLSQHELIIDPGGNDKYILPEGKHPPKVQVVIDLAGNDHYEHAGSSIGGISIFVDHAGDDTYDGKSYSFGCGVMGVGILLDRAGSDTYTGSAWSQGVAAYGVGALIDLGGSDRYIAQVVSQGVGGPKGFGVCLDAGGRDSYRATGIDSAYGTPANYYSMSQGIGIGIRQYDSGGIGVLYNAGGETRYEGGEFSQGGGYYWGFGILHDGGGSDLYFGDRYAQGFGCHRGLGIVVDDGGDDVYWSMTAAAQGAAWDEAAGMLLDKGGNDSYQSESLSQGAAANQSVGILLDLAGNDRYAGRPAEGATNEYHFIETGVRSLSFFLDAGGGQDIYTSADRKNDATIPTGKDIPEKPETANLHGIFIDSAESISP